MNESQTTPPFAQVVDDESSGKPTNFDGFLDYKYQVRNVDPSERRMPIPAPLPVRRIEEDVSPINRESSDALLLFGGLSDYKRHPRCADPRKAPTPTPATHDNDGGARRKMTKSPHHEGTGTA